MSLARPHRPELRPAVADDPNNPRAFRDVLGWFATGVAVVTARLASGGAIGVTVNSFTSVSLDPPMVLFCLGNQARTLSAFQDAGAFAINILASGQQDWAVRFATEAQDWRGVPTVSWVTGAPIIVGCVAALDCALHADHDAGDHRILIGHVLRLNCEAAGAPLVYHRGDYVGLADDTLTPTLKPL